MHQKPIQSKNFEGEVNLNILFSKLFEAKKTIILITLFTTILSFIYSEQQKPFYKSNTVIEIGDINNNNDLIEDLDQLISELNIDFIHIIFKENYSKIKFNILESRLLELQVLSESDEINRDLLNEVSNYVINRHEAIVKNNTQEKIKKLTNKLLIVKNEIDFYNSLLIKNNNEDRELINVMNNEIENSLEAIDKKNIILKQMIIDDQSNLALLNDNYEFLVLRAAQSPSLQEEISSYKTSIIENNLQREILLLEKVSLEKRLKLLDNNNLSPQLFKLSQSEMRVNEELASITLPQRKTRVINKINTQIIEVQTQFILIVGALIGLFSSIFLVLIINFIKSLRNNT